MRHWLPLLLIVTACDTAVPADAVRAYGGGPGDVAAAVAGGTPSGAPAFMAGVPGLDFTDGTLSVRGHRVAVAIAGSDDARRQGLSGQTSLAPDTGLVLQWERPSYVAIWMPDMNFALDVVFVASGHISHITANAQPCVANGPCPTFGPTTRVDYVLEVPAGSSARWGLQVGDAIALVR